MRAMQFDDFGAPDVLHPADVAAPQAGPGWVQIRVAAIGVNPADFKWRQGMFRQISPVKLPHIVGYDVAGVVSAIGQGVTTFKPGDRVAASVRGAYAEYVVAELKAVARLRDGYDFGIAASLPCAALTGVQLIEDGLHPAKGESVLITGATGAVGRFSVHAAAGLGVKIIAAVRPDYFEEATRLGAHEVIELEGKAPASSSFDYVADTVGGPAVARLCRHLAPGGSIMTVSTTPIDPAGLSVKPVFFAYHPDGLRLERLLDEVAAGKIDMPIARRLPLTGAAEAHRLMEKGGLRGKIILEP